MSGSILKFNVSIRDFKALQLKHILLMAWSFRVCLTTSRSHSKAKKPKWLLVSFNVKVTLHCVPWMRASFLVRRRTTDLVLILDTKILNKLKEIKYPYFIYLKLRPLISTSASWGDIHLEVLESLLIAVICTS